MNNIVINNNEKLESNGDSTTEQFSVVAKYKNLELKKFDLSHDKFFIIDDDIYHIGAIIKDIGKKWFTFSKMDKDSVMIMEKLV